MRKYIGIVCIVITMLFLGACNRGNDSKDSIDAIPVDKTKDITSIVSQVITNSPENTDQPGIPSQGPEEITPSIIEPQVTLSPEDLSLIEGEITEIPLDNSVTQKPSEEELVNEEEGEAYPRISNDGTEVLIDNVGTTLSISMTEGEVTITGVIECLVETIIIPTTIGEFPVTTIGQFAFTESQVQNVVLPKGIKELQEKSFYQCVTLTSVSIPSTVLQIGVSAFGNCPNLETIELVGENENYVLVEGVLYSKDKKALIKYPTGRKGKSYSVLEGVEAIEDSAFSMSSKLFTVVLPNSILTLGAESFAACINVSVILPDTIVSIGEYAFADCYNLKKISLPSKIRVLSEGIFSGCEGLTSITIPSKVEVIKYSAFAGATALKEITFKGGTRTIGALSFAFCSALTKVTIPDGTMGIEDMAFFSCQKLEDIVIPETVSYFGNLVFDEAPQVVITTPKGTAAEQYAELNNIRVKN